jgi:hypothetical protein
VESLDEELDQLAGAVLCRRLGCAHPYPVHQDAGGRCGHVINDRFPCLCPGMQWVDPDGPATSYGQPPQVS